MAEQYTNTSVKTEEGAPVVDTPPTETITTDRGLFGFGKKKEEDAAAVHHPDSVAQEFHDKVNVSDHHPHHSEEKKECQEGEKHQGLLEKLHPHSTEEEKKEEEKKHHGLGEKLHRSGSSSSSSSSSDEEGDDEEKKRRRKERKEKKSLKDKVKEQIHHGEEDKPHHEDASVPVEKIGHHGGEEVPAAEKKGLMDKIKEKLPGGKKPAAETATEHHDQPAPVVTHVTPAESAECGGEKDKKGFLEKIKDKIPGFHGKTEEEKEKEKEKDVKI